MCLHQDVRASLCASSPKDFKHALLTAERIKTEALLLGILSEASTGHHRLIIKKLPMESLQNFMLWVSHRRRITISSHCSRNLCMTGLTEFLIPPLTSHSLPIWRHPPSAILPRIFGNNWFPFGDSSPFKRKRCILYDTFWGCAWFKATQDLSVQCLQLHAFYLNNTFCPATNKFCFTEY